MEYIPSGEEITITIKNCRLAFSSTTTLDSTDNFLSGSNEKTFEGKGEFSKTSKMLEKAVTVTVKKG